MKIRLKSALLGLLGMTSLAAHSAQAASITIANFSFESPDLLGCGNCGAGVVPGWNVTGQAQVAQGQVTTPDGVNYLQIGVGTAGHVDQTLSAVLLANTTYTLTYFVGTRADFPNPGPYTVAFEANSVVLASSSSAYTGGPGQMQQKTITFTSPGSVTAGQHLQIAIDLAGVSGNGHFDDFALNATTASGAAPEPRTVAMAASAIGLLGWLRRRK